VGVNLRHNGRVGFDVCRFVADANEWLVSALAVSRAVRLQAAKSPLGAPTVLLQPASRSGQETDHGTL
ncbi:hypothetical protein, partial [Methylobacterium nigriterrae]|uniref:hypothetical protein n=1 Tax=Methylobacterium nigriterrae TaxID=3127512 RepID=UPI0030141280